MEIIKKNADYSIYDMEFYRIHEDTKIQTIKEGDRSIKYIIDKKSGEPIFFYEDLFKKDDPLFFMLFIDFVYGKEYDNDNDD